MSLPDPLLIVRALLLESAAVTGIVADRVYATPMLPVDHPTPLIRLTHIGTTGHAPVGFRQSAVATIQLDAWALDQGTCRALGELALDHLQQRHRAGLGLLSIKPTFEASSLDESVQPPQYRYRADLAVRVSALTPVAP